MATRDLVRRIAVITSFCFMIVAAMLGAGLFGGTPVPDLLNGALDADASYVAPARPAFSIWTVIYAGLLLYTVWQALPRQGERDRQRALGWFLAGTMALNGLWLVVAQYSTLPLTVAAIVVLLAALAITFWRTVSLPGYGIVDRLLIDGVTGLHLGWVTLAAAANAAAWLTRSQSAAEAAAWGVGIVVFLGLIGLAISALSGWRLAPALAISWGLAWVAVGRLAGEPRDPGLGTVAVVVALVLLIVSLVGTVMRQADEVRNAE